LDGGYKKKPKKEKMEYLPQRPPKKPKQGSKLNILEPSTGSYLEGEPETRNKSRKTQMARVGKLVKAARTKDDDALVRLCEQYPEKCVSLALIKLADGGEVDGAIELAKACQGTDSVQSALAEARKSGVDREVMDFLGKVILKNLEEEEDVADGQSDEEST